MRGSKSLVCKRAGPPDGHIRRNDPQRGSPTGWEIRPAGRSATQPRQGQTDDKTETQKMNQLGSVHRASVWKSQNPDPDPNCSVPALTPNQPVPLSLVLFHPAFLSKNCCSPENRLAHFCRFPVLCVLIALVRAPGPCPRTYVLHSFPPASCLCVALGLTAYDLPNRIIRRGVWLMWHHAGLERPLVIGISSRK
eukprot:XP_011531518.1 uncharacterized protein LOC105374378 isoform X2 [Homo sapiens]